ncbi:hypothetical protein Cgig2_029171 [Carnegiea gigantea]|uniref:K Homology domain-containing protein n=1 Tax=Carnegiea gigantea TaxID=171969 RepID=A0A9Q1KLS3_9CARY|nr:hypothetical protein Cgig2_029171 [Carnegiea gigantea]
MSQSQSHSQTKNPKPGRPGKPSQLQTQRAINLTVSEGQASFRLLCSVHAAGGVIGHSGTVVKRLERETSARIHVEDAVSAACLERVIHVIASQHIDRTLRLDDGEVFEVSAVQDALIRVFERMLEVSEDGDGGVGVVRCRLLLAAGMAGAVIGEGGKRINKIMKETSAHIKVFSAGSLPPCAAVSDELLQITGGSQAVKKALLLVSQYLQKVKPQVAGTSSTVLHPNMATNIAGINAEAVRGVAREVVFRLMCPCDAAGAVLGWKGRKVKALENETGACIYFSVPEAGCNERVITVSAFESQESDYSAAQNAVLRVFNEFTSSVGCGTVTARLLIHPNQAGWLNVGESSVISSIEKATDAKLQILEGNCVPGATTNERIIQIDGDYSSVLVALFQVSWRLRGSYFDTLLAPLLPHKIFNACPYVNEAAMLTEKMNNCRVEVNASLPQKFPQSQFSNKHNSTRIGSPTELAAADGGSELRSRNASLIVTNTKVEIVIHEDVFGSVYGDNGSNLARLRQISGATVDVQDPCPGSEGKVIISGTPDQVLAAQSLLQAFIMSAR